MKNNENEIQREKETRKDVGKVYRKKKEQKTKKEKDASKKKQKIKGKAIFLLSVEEKLSTFHGFKIKW